jgi:hypothetical protein
MVNTALNMDLSEPVMRLEHGGMLTDCRIPQRGEITPQL